MSVWVALASRRHVHAAVCGTWWNSIASDMFAFCRVTQKGLLRLLTSASVMGPDVLSSRDAWRTYDAFIGDSRVQFAPEPFALEDEWRSLTQRDQPAPKVWTDAYLAAFARAGSMQLVTLDRAVLSLDREALLLR